MSDEEFPYQKKWERYRLYIKLWMIMLPLLFAAYVLLAANISFIPQKAVAYSLVLFWIVFIIINLSIMFWKCPRCNRNYFKWWTRINILFDYNCRFCGLKKYEGSSLKSRSRKFGKRFGF